MLPRVLARDVADASEAARVEDAQPATAEPTPRRTARERMAEVQDLWDNGLLSQAEYDAKRKEIIDSI